MNVTLLDSSVSYIKYKTQLETMVGIYNAAETGAIAFYIFVPLSFSFSIFFFFCFLFCYFSFHLQVFCPLLTIIFILRSVFDFNGLVSMGYLAKCFDYTCKTYKYAKFNTSSLQNCILIKENLIKYVGEPDMTF